MKKIGIVIVVLVVGLVSSLSFGLGSPLEKFGKQEYGILNKWELPEVLAEISGIAWIGDNKVACVQDEDGTIFIYDLKSSKVEKVIPFAGGGDYEGITVVGDDAYILRSDGIIFEVSDFMKADAPVKKHTTYTNQLAGINIEGLCSDPESGRLLLAVKERKDLSGQKEIYAYDPEKNGSGDDPLFIVDLGAPIFEKVNGKQKNKFMPGEIAIHPKTGDYYILDGSRPKLLILDKNGTPKELFILKAKDFGNPEGLTFSPDGDLYISNEAENAPANILRISLSK